MLLCDFEPLLTWAVLLKLWIVIPGFNQRLKMQLIISVAWKCMGSAILLPRDHQFSSAYMNKFQYRYRRFEPKNWQHTTSLFVLYFAEARAPQPNAVSDSTITKNKTSFGNTLCTHIIHIQAIVTTRQFNFAFPRYLFYFYSLMWMIQFLLSQQIKKIEFPETQKKIV